jgi:hypothetical protein
VDGRLQGEGCHANCEQLNFLEQTMSYIPYDCLLLPWPQLQIVAYASAVVLLGLAMTNHTRLLPEAPSGWYEAAHPLQSAAVFEASRFAWEILQQLAL